MPSIKVNETELFYTEDGDGKPLVFIHGLGASHHMFEPQIETFRSTHRVICPDVRGNGQSGKLFGPIKTVLDRQCDDIVALLDYLGVEKAVFCGVSYGGVFSFHFALRYPDRVAGMVIADSFGDTYIVGVTEAMIMLSQYAALWASYLPSSWMIPSIKRAYRRWPLAQKYLEDIVKNMRKHEFVLQRIAINIVDHTSHLNQIRCPVLGIVGDSTKVGVRYMQRAMDAIPDAEFTIVPNSFDPTNLCQRETFDHLMTDFLKKIGW